MISRVGRSPLGAPYRSPLGALQIGTTLGFGIVRIWGPEYVTADIYSETSWEGDPRLSSVQCKVTFPTEFEYGELFAAYRDSGSVTGWAADKLWDNEDLWDAADAAWIGEVDKGFVCTVAEIRSDFGAVEVYPHSYSSEALAAGYLKEATAACWPPNEQTAYSAHSVLGVASSVAAVTALVKSVVSVAFDESGNDTVASDDWVLGSSTDVQNYIEGLVISAIGTSIPYVTTGLIDSGGRSGTETLTFPTVNLAGPYSFQDWLGVWHTITNIQWLGFVYNGAIQNPSTPINSTSKLMDANVSKGEYVGVTESYFFGDDDLRMPYGDFSDSLSFVYSGSTSHYVTYTDNGSPGVFQLYPTPDTNTRECALEWLQKLGTEYIVRSQSGTGVPTLG